MLRAGLPGAVREKMGRSSTRPRQVFSYYLRLPRSLPIGVPPEQPFLESLTYVACITLPSSGEPVSGMGVPLPPASHGLKYRQSSLLYSTTPSSYMVEEEQIHEYLRCRQMQQLLDL